MESYEKLKAHLPEIAKIVSTFPEDLRESVYQTLVSALLEKKGESSTKTGNTAIKSPPRISSTKDDDDLSAIATVTPEGKFYLTVRDLKAKTAKDAIKRLIYVTIRSYSILMNTTSVSRKSIINPELTKWRLADGNDRSFISSDKGILKDGDNFSLDIHAQNEADQFIREIKDPEIVGSWKPGTTKRAKRGKNGAEKGETPDQDATSAITDDDSSKTQISNTNIQTHTLDEIRHTSTISQIIGVKTGLDLIIAAATKMWLIDNNETFTRVEVLKEMAAAKSYYSSSFNNNCSKYLRKLVREGKLRENLGNYSLSAETRKEMRNKLGLT